MTTEGKTVYRLFLDSGAHSLHNLYQKGGGRSKKSSERFDFYRTKDFADYMDRYADFVLTYEDMIEVYATVDVINNPELTYKAQKYLEKKGIHPIPVLHFGTDLKWLHRYLDEGYQYIALGGLKGIGRQGFVQWADRIFDVLCSTPDRLPRVKVHGFAVTAIKVMLRYPWYSVDSTTWCVYARNGVVMVPRWSDADQCFVYDENITPIVFSKDSPSINEVGGRHFDTLPGRLKERAAQYIESIGYKIGSSSFVTVLEDYVLQKNEQWAEDHAWEKGQKVIERIIEPGVSNNYVLRDEANIRYFLDLSKHIPAWPWPFRLDVSSTAAEGLGI